MAKRPKPINSKAADSPTHPGSTPESSSIRGDHSGISGRSAFDIEQAPGTGASTDSPDIAPRQTIVVTDIPVSGAGAVATASNLTSWPRHQIDQLFRIHDTGLFMSAEQKLYADTGAEGLFRIEPNAKGEYQVPLPFAPDQPGPILAKIPGEPRWRIERQGLDTAVNGKTVFMQPSDASAKQTLQVILPSLADKLTKADAKGLRYDKLKRTYVDVVEEGTVLVRKNVKREYQATTNSELVPSGPVLESIEGLTLWQRTPQHPVRSSGTDDSGPGPNKRPRLGDDIEPAETEANITPVTATTTTNPYLWASWGKITKPHAVESIQIGQLYYPIVPQGPLADKLPFAFIQHPKFAPSRFEPFERMLQEAPELQPVLTYRTGQDPQKVNGAQPVFIKPLTRYVADTFKHFTDQTSRVVAKQLFELSSDAGEINGSGIARMMQTLRHWEGTSSMGVSRVGDPLDMLPVNPSREVSRRIVSLLVPDSVKHLQQLNFNASHHWNVYANDPSAKSLKTMFINLLNESGYDASTPGGATILHTLIFKRPSHPKVYFLKLGRVATDDIEIRTPLTPELDDPLLKNQMNAEMHQTLVAANARNDLVWLIGGVQQLPAKIPSIFIIRDR